MAEVEYFFKQIYKNELKSRLADILYTFKKVKLNFIYIQKSHKLHQKDYRSAKAGWCKIEGGVVLCVNRGIV